MQVETTIQMKDFYDILLLRRIAEHDYQTLAAAIQNTFRRSKVLLPTSLPDALTDDFAKNQIKQGQWKAFLHRTPTLDAPVDFSEVVAGIRDFLTPALIPPAISPVRWIPKQGWIVQ